MTTIRLPKCPLPMRALPAIAAMLAGLVFASTAPAQSGTWKWLDAQGRTVYSDRPPPAGARITQLKAPDGRSPAGVSSTTPAGPHARSAEASPAADGGDTEPERAVEASAANDELASNGASVSAGAAPSASSAPGWVERDRQSRQRAAERKEAEAKQVQASQQLADQQRACEEARAGLQTLESGVRMHAVNDKGERIVLDDAERSRRAETLRRVLGENCAKPPT